MSNLTQPAEPRPHSITAAAIGTRLANVHGRGSDLAALVWFSIVAHMPWDGADRPTWASNETLSEETGLPERDLQRALARLRDAGMLSTHEGHRPGAGREWGRVLVPNVAEPVRVLMPTTKQMGALWTAGFQVRKRPAAIVTLMVGMFVIAAHERGRRPWKWASVPGSLASIRRFVGGSRGSTFMRRFDDLEAAGLISRKCGLTIAPPSKWVVRTPEPAQAPVRDLGPPAWHDDCAPVPMDHDPQWEACEWG